MNPWARVLASLFCFWNPLKTRPRLLIFLIFFVVGVGGLGIWIPLAQYCSGVPMKEIDLYRCFATYVIAIAITSFAEYSLERGGEDGTLTLILFGFVLVVSIAAVLILVIDSVATAKICTGVSSLLTLWLWLIAVADRSSFEEADPQQAIGGAI